MSDEEETSEFTETTTEGGGSESNLTEETTTGSTTNTNDTSTGSTANTNDTSTGSTTYTNDTSTGSEYESTEESSKSSKDSGKSRDRDSIDLEWNEQNFLLPADIFNLDSRKIRSEDPHWALSPVPELATIIIRDAKSIKGPGLSSLKANAETEQWKQILEVLPLDMPFSYTLSVIDDGIYWMRHCTERWSDSEIWRYGDSWKTMLIEREVQEEIENFNPENSEIKELENFLETFRNYVFRLQIQKLVRIDKKRFAVDLSLEDFDDLLDEFINEPDEHQYFLNLEKVLGCLKNLQELNFILMPSCLDPETHQLSIKDFNCFLRGLRQLQRLQKFRCSNGIATNVQLNILARHYIPYKQLTELNMSYNFINDEYCDAFGQLLISSCPLKVLVLKYNRISDLGAIVIASALSVNKSLRKLDLSLNWIGNEGGSFFAKIISTHQLLEDFDISNNKLGYKAGLSFAEAIKDSKHLRNLNLSHNYFGKEAGSKLARAMDQNSTILDLGIKFCSMSPANEDAIYRAVVRNRITTYATDEDGTIKRLKF